MPLLFKFPNGNVLFTLITKQQAIDLGNYFQLNQAIWVSKSLIKSYSKWLKNEFNRYAEILPFSATSSYQQTIVSVVPYSNLYGKKVNTHEFECFLPSNRRDYDVDGFTVFIGFQWVYEQVMFPIFQRFHGNVHFGSGLQRNCTQHLGKFFWLVWDNLKCLMQVWGMHLLRFIYIFIPKWTSLFCLNIRM